MRKNVLLLLLASLLAFGLVFTACDGGGGGGGGSEAASVAGTTWIAEVTRNQLAQIMAEEMGGTVAFWREMLASEGIPSSFPFVRLRFAATGNTVRLYEYNLKDSTWDFQGTGTYTQNGNNLTVTADGETTNTTIVGGNRFNVTVDGTTLTFRRQ